MIIRIAPSDPRTGVWAVTRIATPDEMSQKAATCAVTPLGSSPMSGTVTVLAAAAYQGGRKPFGFLELMARVEAVLRRVSGRTARVEAYEVGGVRADFRKGEVRRNGKLLEVSARELRLLQYFVEHRGEVVGRDQLLDAVWDYDAAPLTRTVDMHVAKLRKKIEDRPAQPRFLVTVHGMGYKFNG